MDVPERRDTLSLVKGGEGMAAVRGVGNGVGDGQRFSNKNGVEEGVQLLKELLFPFAEGEEFFLVFGQGGLNLCTRAGGRTIQILQFLSSGFLRKASLDLLIQQLNQRARFVAGKLFALLNGSHHGSGEEEQAGRLAQAGTQGFTDCFGHGKRFVCSD